MLLNQIKKLNLIAHLCKMCLGEEHPPIIRYCAGGVIMLAGVLVAKEGGQIHAYHFHYIADVLGYGIHGIGAVPFVEWLIEFEREERKNGGLWWPEIHDHEQIDPLAPFGDDPEKKGNGK